jgi:hypothetical protein
MYRIIRAIAFHPLMAIAHLLAFVLVTPFVWLLILLGPEEDEDESIYRD